MADRAIHALLVEMLRSGIVPQEVLINASAELDAVGDHDGAHGLNCLLVAAKSEPAANYVARTKRPRLRVVPDGGKSPA